MSFDVKCDGKGPKIYMSIVMISTEISERSAFLCKDGINNLYSQLKREPCLSVGLTSGGIQSRRGKYSHKTDFT